jgi:hypothetical protein
MKYLKIFESTENITDWKSGLLELSDYFVELEESGIECTYEVGYKSQRNERVYWKLFLGENETITGVDGGSPQSIKDDIRELESYLRMGNRLAYSVNMSLPYDEQNSEPHDPKCGVKTLEKFSEILKVYNSVKRRMSGYEYKVKIYHLRMIEILLYKI